MLTRPGRISEGCGGCGGGGGKEMVTSEEKSKLFEAYEKPLEYFNNLFPVC